MAGLTEWTFDWWYIMEAYVDWVDLFHWTTSDGSNFYLNYGTPGSGIWRSAYTSVAISNYFVLMAWNYMAITFAADGTINYYVNGNLVNGANNAYGTFGTLSSNGVMLNWNIGYTYYAAKHIKIWGDQRYYNTWEEAATAVPFYKYDTALKMYYPLDEGIGN